MVCLNNGQRRVLHDKRKSSASEDFRFSLKSEPYRTYGKSFGEVASMQKNISSRFRWKSSNDAKNHYSFSLLSCHLWGNRTTFSKILFWRSKRPREEHGLVVGRICFCTGLDRELVWTCRGVVHTTRHLLRTRGEHSHLASSECCGLLIFTRAASHAAKVVHLLVSLEKNGCAKWHLSLWPPQEITSRTSSRAGEPCQSHKLQG